ncbi:MAG: cation diffusion facilitator family transporter [Bacillota bacterium]
MKPNKSRESVMLRSFFVNITMIIVKVIGGFAVNSAALIADAVHSTSDLFSDILVLLGLRESQKPPDSEHPLGHGKIEYVLSIFLGLGVLFIAYQLIRDMILNIGDGPEVPNIYGSFIVIFVIAVKIFLARYLTYYGNRLDSQILKASGKESFTDVMGSLVVLGGFLMSFLGDRYDINALRYGDRVAAFFIALLVIYVGIRIIRDAITFVLGKSAPEETIKEIKDTVCNINGVKGVDTITAITYGHYYQVTLDVVVDGELSVEEGHDIAHDVRDALTDKHNIQEAVVHINPEVKA